MQSIEISSLLKERSELAEVINSLVHGTIEIRKNNNIKYLYVHYRENKKIITRYVDKYSEKICNIIVNNNLEVSRIKSRIRKINKKLRELNYDEQELSKIVRLNIDFVRKNLIDTIYKQSILEGITTTEADTKNVLEGGIVNGMTSTDVMKIINLKHAWDFILDENVILSPTDFNLLSYINKLVIENFYYNAGIVRTTPVIIGGTTWTPNIPIESEIKEDINKIINKKKDDVDKAIELLLYIMKRQIFIDGNKRTAVIFANHYLISKGLGLIVIPAELTEHYKELLISYYEGKDSKKIKDFLKNLCYIKIY